MPEKVDWDLLRAIKLSRIRVKNVKKAVDNDPPSLNVSVYWNGTKLRKDRETLDANMDQNRKLVKNINTIYRVGGRTCCHSDPQIALYAERQTRYKLSINETRLKVIRKRTNELMKRCQNVQSDYAKRLLDEAYEKLMHTQSASKSPSSGGDVERRSNIASKFNPALILQSWSICPPGIPTDISKRKICFFDVSINGFKMGRLVFEIFADVVPKTAANFVSLCKTESSLTYMSTIMHSVIPGYFCIGGDVVNYSGTGGTSIYGPTFADENFVLDHSGPGVVSMFKTCPDANNSQYMITFKKLVSLDGKYVVIGRVATDKSLHVLERIQEFGTQTGKTRGHIVIKHCGVLR